MRIDAVATTMNEADIIRDTVEHLIDNGVTHVWLADASTDDTRAQVDGLPVTILDDPEDYHYQPMWITRLANLAGEAGADWIIPFDADEFWCSRIGGTVHDALASAPDGVGIVRARMLHHLDRIWREPEPKPLTKAAFRYAPTVEVALGNHDVFGVPGEHMLGVLEIREIQYRGVEQFIRKVRERCATIDPALPWTEGTHHRVLGELTDDELRAEWTRRLTLATVRDPIPTP